jgi:NTP pyrophosphatase (non-canonical NTP hydrolase)
MKLDTYHRLAKGTAIYPGELMYPALGLCGELGELTHAWMNFDNKELIGEIGDVLWYVANTAADAGMTLAEVMGRKTFPKRCLGSHRTDVLAELMIAAGMVAENVKKTFRDHDGKLKKRRKKNIKIALRDIVFLLTALLSESDLDMTLEEIARANIDKLDSRRERNVQKGDGNNR